MIWGGEGAHAACPQPGLMFVCCCLCNCFCVPPSKGEFGTGGVMMTTATPGPSLPAPRLSLVLPKAICQQIPLPPAATANRGTWCAVPGLGSPRPGHRLAAGSALGSLLPQPAPLVSSRHKTFNLNSTSKPQSTHSISPELWKSLHSPRGQAHPRLDPSRATCTVPRGSALAEHMQPETHIFIHGKGGNG